MQELQTPWQYRLQHVTSSVISLPETMAFFIVSNTIQTALHVLPADILCTTTYHPPSFAMGHCSGLIDGPSGTPNLLFGI